MYICQKKDNYVLNSSIGCRQMSHRCMHQAHIWWEWSEYRRKKTDLEKWWEGITVRLVLPSQRALLTSLIPIIPHHHTVTAGLLKDRCPICEGHLGRSSVSPPTHCWGVQLSLPRWLTSQGSQATFPLVEAMTQCSSHWLLQRILPPVSTCSFFSQTCPALSSKKTKLAMLWFLLENEQQFRQGCHPGEGGPSGCRFTVEMGTLLKKNLLEKSISNTWSHAELLGQWL